MEQTVETSIRAIKLGARFVLHATDAGFLQRAIQNEMSQLRKAAGKESGVAKNTVEIV